MSPRMPVEGSQLLLLLLVFLLAAVWSVSPDGGGGGGGQENPAEPEGAESQRRLSAQVNVREWSLMVSDSIRAVSNKSHCLADILRAYESQGRVEQLEPSQLRDEAIGQMQQLLSQHRAAVSAIASEAERLAVAHTFVKNLRVNYTDVHRLRNELEPLNASNPLDMQLLAAAAAALNGNGNGQSQDTTGNSNYPSAAGNVPTAGQGPQFTSIAGGTPVPGPPEWQTPIKSIVLRPMQNFGELPVNTSMSAVHLPLPIYPGLPEIMNGIAWTEKLDGVFKRNLANYSHVHHQYYGDHLGFLRTFPAHKWRVPRQEPDLFDARTRPWYAAGASSPKDMVILVDTSGSMTGLRREIAKGVVFELLDTLTQNDYFAVLRFSETVTPVGLPKCALRTPKLGGQLEEQCRSGQTQAGGRECQAFRRQQAERGRYLEEHPEAARNGSYLTDEQYLESIGNVTEQIADAYLLPASSRHVRYLKSNFSMPTAGIANFTRALMAAFELLQAYNRSGESGGPQASGCNQAIMLITDGAIRDHQDLFHRYNYPGAPVRLFTYVIGREVGDISHSKAMACNNRGYYAHVINLGEVREQVQKYLPVLARPLVLGRAHPVSWTNAYGDETHQVLSDWALEAKRRERARLMLIEERERLTEQANSSDVINIELTNIAEYDELALVDEELKNRIICEDSGAADASEPQALEQSLQDELDPLGANELACHWSQRRADLLISVVRPVFDTRNSTLYFQRVLSKNIWTERASQARNAQLLGMAAVDLRLADLLRPTPSHLLGPNAYAILLGHSGFVLHHPDYRPLLEDPFDRQSRFLKPYFNALDLTHIEQAYSQRNESGRPAKDEQRLFRLRELAVRGQSGVESVQVKRAIDCRRRLHIRHQLFYYGPLKETPFVYMLALPQNYGLNRLVAERELGPRSWQALRPSRYDLWTLHPDYRYCERSGDSPANDSQVALLVELLRAQPAQLRLANLSDLSVSSSFKSAGSGGFLCDEKLFPALLFDAEATHEPAPECAPGDADCAAEEPRAADSCARSQDYARSKLASATGLELAFVATRAGLTRVKLFELGSARIKKLAEVFAKRHSRAADESWYARTVDWNMRFFEDATLVSAPFNGYVRLVAKLRQRITQRQPAANDTRANCDPSLDADEPEEADGLETTTPVAAPDSTLVSESTPAAEQTPAADQTPAAEQTPAERPDYAHLSSFELLELVANSSVHISATQTLMFRAGTKQRTPVAVAGSLYDYAAFARSFLNATSLDIRQLGGAGDQPSVELCPGGACPTRCGLRNDTIDCLLLDNNAFIVVGEELAHVGRPLADYDEALMGALVERRLFHKVQLTDYQGICARDDNLDQASAGRSASQSALASAQLSSASRLAGWAANALAALASLHSLLLTWLASSALAAGYLAELAGLAAGQSAVANQSLLALLPNKTYLRPCERQQVLYETRPVEPSKLLSEQPRAYTTKCGCPAWFVYDLVPKTNLVVLIVNTTAACSRRCPERASNLVPVPAPPPPPSMVDLAAGGAPAANKTQEDLVCAMLERDAQLYVRKTDTCYAHHPDEAQIQICGGGTRPRPPPALALLGLLLLLASARAGLVKLE